MQRYWTNLLFRSKRSDHKKVLFYQDNAMVHTSTIAMSKLHQLKYELVKHIPYFPDLAPSDYYLFPNFKKLLGGERFTSHSEVMHAVSGYFEDFDKSYFSEGIKKLEIRFIKLVHMKCRIVKY